MQAPQANEVGACNIGRRTSSIYRAETCFLDIGTAPCPVLPYLRALRKQRQTKLAIAANADARHHPVLLPVLADFYSSPLTDFPWPASATVIFLNPPQKGRVIHKGTTAIKRAPLHPFLAAPSNFLFYYKAGKPEKLVPYQNSYSCTPRFAYARDL